MKYCLQLPSLHATMLLLLFSLFCTCIALAEDSEYAFVTIGSALKLSPVSSSQFRLHSHDLNWGSGSGQQSVTAFPGDGDTNSLWSIHAPFGNTISSGSVIQCGDIIRLKHVRTRNYLHSHLHQSPLSNQQEVSCYPGGNSDSGDNWRIVCQGKWWSRSRAVAIQHVDTGMYLSTDTAAKFNQHNCRNCPIQGQLEVRASQQKNRLAMWKTAEGFFVPVSEDMRDIVEDSKDKDEE
jgi:dolichyl-phosphate-mannose--protein O-mannosyl transferase